VIRRYCVNARGLEPLLTNGWVYSLRPLQCGAVAVFDTQGDYFVCSGDRFGVKP
jgi:hypothetical protein